MTLTTDEQKKLTLFLGECWHELDGYRGSMGTCKKCGAWWKGEGFVHRLDFTDWRVVGRLIEKAQKEQWVGMNEANGETCCMIGEDNDGFVGVTEFATTPQEAICRAVLAYIDAGKEDK
jgi:hypothetical protein